MLQAKQRNKLTCLLLALASLVIPGIGQVFSGRFLRGIALLSLLPLTLAMSHYTHLLDYFASALIFYFVLITLFLFTAYDAYKLNAQSGGIKLQWYNKWYFYICIALCFYLIEIGAISVWGYRHFRVVGDSNNPILQNGDIVMVKMGNETEQFYPIGSMIIYQPPFTDEKIAWTGRIVATGGTTFDIKNGNTSLDNKPVNEIYTLPSNDKKPRSRNFGPHKVPSGYILALGDNRDGSVDSRNFGFIPVKNIQGRILYILWSSDMHRIGLKLD